ncbi:hypothetical protein [Inquilinus sp. CAU 1745]|uniref:hypothetical protein n=1 Tax=Inquilinus sp. CAU 1745 TaxID=3140369 RepID=UPI00325B01DA
MSRTTEEWATDNSLGSRLEGAVAALAISGAPMKERIKEAYSCVHCLRIDDFPEQYQADAETVLNVIEKVERIESRNLTYFNYGSLSTSEKKKWAAAVMKLFKVWNRHHGHHRPEEAPLHSYA